MVENYLRPDYSVEEGEDFDDISDFDESEEDKKVEQFNKSIKMVTTTPFNNGGNTATWGTGNSTSGSSFWSNNPTSTPQPFGWSNNSPAPAPTWGGVQTPIYSPGFATGEKKELPRSKSIVFCDILDCIVETYQSQGKPGLIPRGIYDIKPRFDVWEKIRCIGPERVYMMVPKQLILSSSSSYTWKPFLEYIAAAVAEYLRMPYTAIQVVTQTVPGQTKSDVMKSMMNTSKLDVRSCVYVGINSGMAGQGSDDILAAKMCEMDYIDLNQLLTLLV